MSLHTGERIDHYTVLEKLGRGGMSEVYHARDEQNQREVVLKFPHEDMAGDPATYERLRREIKIGTTLDHPNIQKLYEISGNGVPEYLVLEYVEGCTLRELLEREAPLPFDKAIDLGVQIARAIGYAHEHKIFHRDLKPENIIVSREGQAKVMDFGIAFVAGARRVTWGRLSAQVGTPDYMAPEQIKGSRGDHRTDIYALGTMLYELLAGRPPYEGDNNLAIMNQHVTMSPPPLHYFRKDVPPALEEAIMKAIRRDPDRRWQSMQEFEHALLHLDSVDVAALRAEREHKEANPALSAVDARLESQLGLPLWQVALIVTAVLVALAAVGVIAQVLHS
jgi:serine/threonine-protein kinase